MIFPGRGQFRPQGAWLAGFIKEITKHCYTQNIKALGLLVSEKVFYVFPIVSLWELMTRGEANLGLRGMINRIFVGYN